MKMEERERESSNERREREAERRRDGDRDRESTKEASRGQKNGGNVRGGVHLVHYGASFY